ncbi:UDP-glucose 4-epimerase [Cryptococcus neoformans C23]|uniref:UDP-glucose 4-epimerase n=1 Tax=Cryptococcus neoformans (strain H99 / ATCC 208821 / CBS 10515 / FGSC 9487) TaxID=235443 RepID=J9VVI1_CRYN9|nr:UDP-glucose 4-epimerase [Cryptococcus neoformans var. grubii H99]AFR98278.2 UDP-glucose 4-epimerase [Cryptococcus neoformans var. grubii H99]AUB28399.1 UDP-glucose 4-epimerase [Cryptococcus neoformans var. grubii]OWZ27086.1 UDP-glucose 4-epimerase [Cryptococcus neoformans var. grubii AD2-60a]OWZ39048.1 UDP-glucose 4-epimerase [Cryptococcus neoformans var. grubii C23]|eukprot:XP_012052980.1 UDP-glucose 4-epimerase [Cryptococcus neoformans var. grubii H99]
MVFEQTRVTMNQTSTSSLSVHGQPLKNVLVTGGLGYIGSHVVLSLLVSGRYLPIIIDNAHNAYPQALERCNQIAQNEVGPHAPKPLYHQCDIRNAEEIDKVFKQYQSKGGIWAVIHLAALKAVGESSEIPLDYYEVNVGGSISLLKIMQRFQTNNLVFSSSATVYGTPAMIPIPETSEIIPESVYGRTKAITEEVIRDVCRADAAKAGIQGLKAISVRYFNPAGAHLSGQLGEEPKGRPGNLLPILAQIAVGRSSSDLKVFGNDYPTRDGTCLRDYLHIMDLAEGHLLGLDALAKSEITTQSSGIFHSVDTKKNGYFRAFNLGRGKGITVLEMINEMKIATGYGYQYEIVERRSGDVPDLTADPRLAKEELGFIARRGLQEMCQDLWRFQSRNVAGYSS